jgi:hypothetical protein
MNILLGIFCFLVFAFMFLDGYGGKNESFIAASIALLAAVYALTRTKQPEVKEKEVAK